MQNVKRGRRPSPLKTDSLAGLRELQRRAARASSSDTDPAAAVSSDPAAGSPTGTTERNKKRHRFFPPSEKTSPRTQGPVQASAPHIATAGTHSTTVPALDADDIALFRRVVQSVKPSPQSDRARLAPVPDGTPDQLKQRRHHAMSNEASPSLLVSDRFVPNATHHDDTEFSRGGQGPHLTKGLRKGKWPVQATLDLHGATVEDARGRLDGFLQACMEHQMRCVRIVHGKGYGSKNGNAVLKETVRRWLTQLAAVLAYVECAESDGGSGAVLVLLRKAQT